MPKVVVDTNVVVSAALSDSPPRAALLRIVERDALFASDPLVAEWQEVLARPRITSRLPRLGARHLLAVVLPKVHRVAPTVVVQECRDPKDDKVLECALAAGADLIVSGDKDLLVLHPWRGIPILSPVDYLAS